MKRAVIYYSLTGNTKKTAELVAERCGADLIRIDMVKPMPEGFKKQIMYGGMLATFGKKPEVTGIPDNITTYDDIILGTPVWASTFAPALRTLFTKKDIGDKVSAVFTLSGSGDNTKCLKKLAKFCPNIKNSVSLSDENSGKPQDNKGLLEEFIKKISG